MMNKEEKLAKVRKSCSVGKGIVKALKIIMIVAAIICLVGAVIVFVERDKVNTAIKEGTVENGVTFDNNEMILDGVIKFSLNQEQLVEGGRYDVVILEDIIVGMVATIFTAIIFGIIESLLHVVIESESPFSEVVIKKFRKLFIVITVFVAIGTGLGAAVATGLVLWCIYTIFDYGYAIQTEVDEIL